MAVRSLAPTSKTRGGSGEVEPPPEQEARRSERAAAGARRRRRAMVAALYTRAAPRRPALTAALRGRYTAGEDDALPRPPRPAGARPRRRFPRRAYAHRRAA